MGLLDYLLIAFVVVAVIGVALFFLNRWASTKLVEQQETMDRVKQNVTIFVIDKKKAKPINSTLPNEVKKQLPKLSRVMKMPLVKAKIGPQIVTLISDKKVYDALPLKKNVKIELAGIYIAAMHGMKNKKDTRELSKSKQAKSKGTVAEPEKWYEKIDPRKLMKSK